MFAFGAPAVSATPDTLPLVANCAAVKQLLPLAQDGQYTLFTGRFVLGVYCHDMAGTPREYLDLANVGGTVNFSQYTAGVFAPGTNVRTTFTKVRVDPATLTVDTGDLTFSVSTGQLLHGGAPVTAMAYAAAMSCDNTASGLGNVELHGTAFEVDDTFAVAGFLADGTVTISPDGQTVALTGGGACGWTAPVPTNNPPHVPVPGNFVLELACAPGGAQRPQPCIDVG